MAEKQVHKTNKTDGYNRAIRDIERICRLRDAGLKDESDEIKDEVLAWLRSQVQLSGIRSKSGEKGGKESAKKRIASSKNSDLVQAPLQAKSDFASTNKESNELKKEEINQEKTGTVLQLPPGFPSSHDTFDAVLSGGVSEVLAKWRTAWKKWKRTEPSIGNLEYRIASENMDYLKEPDIDNAFKWFLTDENAKEFGGHSFKAFCKDPAKWLGKYRDSLPKDRRDEIAKLEAEQRAEQEKILKRDFDIDPEQDKPLDLSTLI